MVLTKGHPLQSSSIHAQGGVAVAMSEEDDVAIHLTDTLKAGHGLCRKEAVRVLVEEGPDRIQELIGWGAKFRQNRRQICVRSGSGAQPKPHLRARGDATGNEMVRVLIGEANAAGAYSAIGSSLYRRILSSKADVAAGRVVLDEDSGRQFVLPARAVVLTTGGAGQIYARTTNPANATGDGMAMALRAGAVLQDMEFVQFHPTALYLPSSPPFLLSEAMRGDGAQLRNNKGELFMQRYHPMGALAPRDIVSRAILAEMAATKSRHVYLDVTHLGRRVREAAIPDDLCHLPSLRHRYHGRVDPGVAQCALYDGRGLD